MYRTAGRVSTNVDERSNPPYFICTYDHGGAVKRRHQFGLIAAALALISCGNGTSDPADAGTHAADVAHVSDAAAIEAGTADAGSDAAGDASSDTDSASPMPATWERIDTNFAITDPYATYRIAADDEHLYALAVVQDEDPAGSWYVMRSSDHGDTWERVFVTSSGRAVRASYFGVLDGDLVLAVPKFGETAVFYTRDRGETWTTATNVPTALVRAVGRDGGRMVVSGRETYRSINGGGTWDETTGTVPIEAFDIVSFGGAFWALDGDGNRHRLAHDTNEWAAVSDQLTGATDAWVRDGVFWLKQSFGDLAYTSDGVDWTVAPTASPQEWGWAFPVPGDASSWFLADEAPNMLFVTDDDGATAIEVTENFPVDDNGLLCQSLYTSTTEFAVAATRSAAFDASGCTPGEDPRAGVYRLRIGR